MCIRKFLLSLLCCPKRKAAKQKPQGEVEVKDDISQKDIVAIQLKNAVEFGKFSFELEEKRGESLIVHSGHMLTAFSLYSAALLMLLDSLISNAIISRTHLFIASTCIAVPLIFSLVFTMLAQRRFKYETLIDADSFRKKFKKDTEHHREQYQFDFQFIAQLHKVQESKKEMNDKRLFYIRVAMLCFFVAIAFLVVAYIILSVLYTKGA